MKSEKRQIGARWLGKTRQTHLPVPRPQRVRILRSRHRVAALTAKVHARDGPACWYCGVETTADNRTLEHLLAVANGGSADLANLCLACADCNNAVGAMTIIEKVAYRERFRQEPAPATPSPEEPRPPSTGLIVRYVAPGVRQNIEAARIKAERVEGHRRYMAERDQREERQFVNTVRRLLPQHLYIWLWEQTRPTEEEEEQDAAD